jgi:hypothetical protein
MAQMQTHFISILGVLAKDQPGVQVAQVSDCAFVHSSDLGAATDFACALYKHMTVRGDQFFVNPLRGGAGQGLNRFLDSKELREVANLKYSSVIGVGNIEAHELEQTGKRGMRLFVTERVGDRLTSLGKHRIRKTQTLDGVPCFEINWMSNDGIVADYLSIEKKEKSIRNHLREYANAMNSTGVSYFQALGESIEDLLGWA